MEERITQSYEKPTLVTLRNSDQVPEVTVNAVYENLETLMEDGLVGRSAIAALVKSARDNQKITSERSLKTLQELGLVEADGRIHDDVKSVVLSAVEGTGLGVTLVSPFEE